MACKQLKGILIRLGLEQTQTADKPNKVVKSGDLMVVCAPSVIVEQHSSSSIQSVIDMGSARDSETSIYQNEVECFHWS